VTDATGRSMGLEAIVRGGSKTATLLQIARSAASEADSLALTLSSSQAGSIPHGTYAARVDVVAAFIYSLIAVLNDGTET
jgi:hypothetical protein